jgi:hypothetical protein
MEYGKHTAPRPVRPVRRHAGGAVTPRWLVAAAVGALLAPLAAQPAAAQESRDFLIGEPVGALSLRGGFSVLRGGSDAFDFVQEQFTLGRRDFHAPAGEADLSFRMTPRLFLMLSGGFSRSAAPSEFRDFVDNNELPIEQVTRLTRVPMALSVKGYLAPTGRSIGRFAWIPNQFAPYAGAGGGMMWHRFEMDGDFIDFNDFAVFTTRYVSDGFAPLAQGFAGLDISLSPRIAFTVEARYQWARAAMGADFEGFDRIDLSGLQTTAGVHLRF